MNYFVYNGTRSCDMGIRIQEKNVFSAPKYDAIFHSIPGRHGDLIQPGGRLPNVQVTYTVFLPAKSVSELEAKLTAVKAWLYADLDQYHELTDTYNSSYLRRAVFAGQLDIEDELNRIGVFTISFSCYPYRFSIAGTEQTEYATGDTVTNPYRFQSKPYLKVCGDGSGTLTLQSATSNATWTFTDINEYVEVDSELMNFYKGAELKNDTVEGSGFPILYPGENAITFTGGITKIIIEPRWVTL